MMTKIYINFAPRTIQQVIVQTRPITWFIGCVGIALCVVAAVMILALMEKNNAHKIAMKKAEAQLVERTLRKTPVKKSMIPDTQVQAINAVIQKLNLPWSDVLDALEEATPPTIAILTLEPDAKKHIVKGMAEAKSSSDMIAYIEQMKKQDYFSNVALTKHEINEQDANKPMRFQFEAQWRELKQ